MTSFEDLYKLSDLTLKVFISTNKLNEDMAIKLFDLLYSADFCKFNTGLLTSYLKQLKETDFTYTHSVRVAWISTMLCKWCGYSVTDCKTAMILGLLHDVGKIGMPDAILNKPSKLTEAEFDLIKFHPMFGSLWLKASDQVSDRLIHIVSSHHERPNGKGYPNGSYYEHRLSRILAISDIFEAMSGERPYKKTFDYKETLSEMLRLAENDDIDSVIFKIFDEGIRRILSVNESCEIDLVGSR